MTLEVLEAGYFTQLQDYGRYGYQHFGITNGGPMDEHAFLWANYLLGNSYNAPQLEISFGGMTARFTKDAMIAICGAEFTISKENRPVSLWQTHFMRRGDVVQFAGPKSGARAYLAVKGGFKVPQQLGSCATVTRETLGGLRQDGSVLQNEDRVPYSSSTREAFKSVPAIYQRSYPEQINLRFFPNRTVTGLSTEGMEEFVSQTYEITKDSNRMGHRLNGRPIEGIKSGIISQGLAMGTIQIPPDGQPIVLLRDRQTMGGYCQAGCVAAIDLSLLAQSAPGVKVTFATTSIEEMESEFLAHRHFFGITN